jgi:hypothetical protein
VTCRPIVTFRKQSGVFLVASWLVFLVPACEKGAAPDDDSGDAGDADAADDADAGPDPLQCEPRTAPLPLDAAPPVGEATAGAVTAEAELIGGELVMAQAGGAWKIANSEVAFVLQGSEVHTGYNQYGGSLIDADLQRPAGEPGNDTFVEEFTIIGYKVATAETISVLCDGNGGRPAVLRIEGHDDVSRLIPQIDALNPRPLNFRIVTDYILEPDSRTLRIRTTSTNNGGRTWSSLAEGDLLLFGSVNKMFSPEVGFGDLQANPPSLIATAADPEEARRRVSYGFASTHGPLTLPVAVEGATGGVGNTVFTLVAGESTVFERLFTVGRDLSSAMEPLLEGLGKPYAVVAGRVTDGAGAPVELAAVVAVASASSPASSAALTDADGNYRLVVAPGTYTLETAKAGYLRGSGDGGTLADGDETTVDLALGTSGSVTLDIRDDIGPCPAKVTLYGLDVESPDRRVGPIRGEWENMGAHRVLMTANGAGTYPVKPGTYRAVATRGPEFGFVEQGIVVPPDGSVTLAATFERLLDTTGWMGGDFHIHTLNSPDGSVSVCERVTEAAAEGLDIAVSTDHEGFTDYRPCVESLGLEPFLWTMIGDEVTNMGTGGHRNAYPMPYDPARVLEHWGPQYWADPEVLSAQALNDKIHAESTNPIIQMNHPRSTDSYFNWSMFNPVTGEVGRTGEELATGWQAMEGSNGSSFPFDDVALLTPGREAELSDLAVDGPRGDVPIWADYLAFLRMGTPIAAMGTSDVHGWNEGTGYARSYLLVNQDDPATLTESDVTTAVRGQRVVVSNGVFLRVTTEGIEAMGAGDIVPLVGTDVELYVEAQAIPDFDLSYLYVFANGRPLYLRRDASAIVAEDTAAGGGTLELALVPGDALDEVVRLATEIRHHPTADTYYHVLVRGIGGMGPLPSNEPFAYTNGIYVDVDGGGWSR